MDFSVLKANLLAKGYKVSCFANAEQAADYLDTQIRQTTVGFGGSATLQEMGLYRRLSAYNRVYWHWLAPKGEELAVRNAATGAEVYLSSVNGISEQGEIINIDGACNRLAAIFYGPKKVYLVIGSNKIAKTYEEALHRARNIAAPLNAKRLGLNTPCAKAGDRCYDCKSPQRICRGLSVLWEKPAIGEYEIVLVDQPLGF